MGDAACVGASRNAQLEGRPKTGRRYACYGYCYYAIGSIKRNSLGSSLEVQTKLGVELNKLGRRRAPSFGLPEALLCFPRYVSAVAVSAFLGLLSLLLAYFRLPCRNWLLLPLPR